MARARTTTAGLERRRQAVLARVAADGEMDIAQLVEEFGVSLMTMHRDLDVLAGRALLRKSRGRATIVPAVTVEVASELRRRTRLAEKEAIAEAALRELPPRGVILMDDSTTLFPLARRLDECGSYTVITNSVGIARIVAATERSKAILLGGDYQSAFDSTTGPEVSRALQRLHADLALMSAVAITGGRLYHPIQGYAAVKEAMLDAAQRHLLLVDSSKFGRHAPFSHRDVSAYDTVITDRGVPQDEERTVRRLGTRLLLVDPRVTAGRPAGSPGEPFPMTSLK
ncbi:DeoR/GlpR family DNA-binding transcription regulator [Streptosporangium sp. NPDC000396]|uniref:DeoR/GlpR family DNA-binding transcription regulator n=1 Tax=Streptosporangium sp. NPDC000396 TaxID=3366185 RepID=UPI0036D1A3D9